MLKPTSEGPVTTHDLLMLDLDGVVYVGADAVPGAIGAIRQAREAGSRVAYVTNNASRTPSQVAEHLQRLGLPATAADVVTSAQAAAHLLSRRHPQGARIFLVGSPALREALAEEGLHAVDSLADDPVAVVSGYAPDLPWRTVMEGAVLVRDGAPWVASNTDQTVPLPIGLAPGHGVQVDMISRFAGVVPEVAGKPQAALFDETVRRVGGRAALVIGDRLDTDIEGANNAGLPSLLVMTGVTGAAELLSASPGQRPTYLSRDLSGLFTPHPVPDPVPADRASGEHHHRLGEHDGWIEDATVHISGPPSSDDWWRILATVGWAHLDDTGEPARAPDAPEQPPGHAVR